MNVIMNVFLYIEFLYLCFVLLLFQLHYSTIMLTFSMSENGFCKLSITLQFYYYIIIHDNKWKQVLKNSSNKRTPDSVEEKEWGVVWEGANRNESRTSFFLRKKKGVFSQGSKDRRRVNFEGLRKAIPKGRS